MTRERLNELGAIILDSSITVHKELGPGLLESAYRLALKRELELRNLLVTMHIPVDLIYKQVNLGKCYEIDLLVENEIIIETKSCEAITSVFMAQVMTYLKLTGKKPWVPDKFQCATIKRWFQKNCKQFLKYLCVISAPPNLCGCLSCASNFYNLRIFILR